MAKIRTLKGEFFRNAGVSVGGLLTKALAAGLICTVADDDGRFKVKAADIRGEIFTHDPVTVEDVDRGLQLLASEDFIRLYHDHGRAFGAVVNWKTHQPVPPSRYKPSVLPAPPNTKGRRHSASSRTQLSTDASSRAGVGSEGNRKGAEGSGEDISPTAHSAVGGEVEPLVLVHEISRTPTEQVFDAWLSATGKNGRTQLDSKRHRLIAGALRSYPLEDVVDAVRGWRHSPHHRGENDRKTVYNGLHVLLRDAEQIEHFRDLERNAPSTQAAEKLHPFDRYALETMGRP